MNDFRPKRLRDRPSGKATLINEGCEIRGEIGGHGDFVISGNVVGDCILEGTLTVAVTGSWQGSIEADHVIVSGRVDGDVRARKKIEIGTTARISGTISGDAIAVAEGAIVEGEMRTNGQSEPFEFTEKRKD